MHKNWMFALLIGFITITVTYGGGKTFSIQGPPDDVYCIARREAIMLHADRIIIPAGEYQATCEAVPMQYPAAVYNSTPNIAKAPSSCSR